MRYALLIHEAQVVRERRTAAEREEALAAHRTLQQETKAAGAFRAALELADPAQATTVRFERGEVLATDGPFAETKEQFVGLYIVECENLAAAIAYAAAIPHARTGRIEIRPIAHYEATAAAPDD